MLKPSISIRKMMILIAVLAAPVVLACQLAKMVGTEYAADYSESRFFKIRTGMDRIKVEALLGKPLKIRNGQGIVANSGKADYGANWYEYSRSPGDGDYEVRRIFFDPSDRVVDIQAFHHTD